MTLLSILQRHAIAEVTPDAVLADLIPCAITRQYTVPTEIDEAFNMSARYEATIAKATGIARTPAQEPSE